MCSPLCSSGPDHRDECSTLACCSSSTDNYGLVTPLRLLSLAKRDPALWSLVTPLMDHCREKSNVLVKF